MDHVARAVLPGRVFALPLPCEVFVRDAEAWAVEGFAEGQLHEVVGEFAAVGDARSGEDGLAAFGAIVDGTLHELGVQAF